MEVVLPEWWGSGEDCSAGRGAYRRAGATPGQNLPGATGAAREDLTARDRTSNVGRTGKDATSELEKGELRRRKVGATNPGDLLLQLDSLIF